MAVDAPAPIGGEIDAAAYEGSYQNQTCRFDVFREDGQLRARMAARVGFYETDNAQAPVFDLARIGEHVFQISRDGVVIPFPMAFVNPDAGGRMQRLGAMARIFNRVAP